MCAPRLVAPRHRLLWQLVDGATAPDDLAHDRYHVLRVYRWAVRLAADVDADPDLAGAAALVHDLDTVPKDSPERALGGERAAAAAPVLLQRAAYAPAEIAQITAAVRTSSWSRGLAPEGPLGAVLQDADRLDAIGAIGIARSFACAQGMTARGRAMRLCDPADPLARAGRSLDEARNAVDHFLVKLTRLADGMHLAAARAEARQRHAQLVAFLDQLAREIAGP